MKSERKIKSATTSPIEQLPEEILNHILSLFNVNELGRLAQVNKFFNNPTKQLIANRIFYAVGKPIPILQVSHAYGYPWKPRKIIPNSEIYQSFLWEEDIKIRLFKTENEALEYSRYLRTGGEYEDWSAATVNQGAIFKVVCVANIKNTDKPQESEILTINKQTHCNIYDFNERNTPVSYFKVPRNRVIALEGILKIHQFHINEFITHGPVNCVKPDLTVDQHPHKHQKKCVIM